MAQKIPPKKVLTTEKIQNYYPKNPFPYFATNLQDLMIQKIKQIAIRERLKIIAINTQLNKKRQLDIRLFKEIQKLKISNEVKSIQYQQKMNEIIEGKRKPSKTEVQDINRFLKDDSLIQNKNENIAQIDENKIKSSPVQNEHENEQKKKSLFQVHINTDSEHSNILSQLSQDQIQENQNTEQEKLKENISSAQKSPEKSFDDPGQDQILPLENYWITALKNCPQLYIQLDQHSDQKILNFLTSIEYLREDLKNPNNRNFTIIFKFKQEASIKHIAGTLLKKSFILYDSVNPIRTEIQGEILKTAKLKKDSFFKFFDEQVNLAKFDPKDNKKEQFDRMGKDTEISLFLIEELIPYSLEYFLGLRQMNLLEQSQDGSKEVIEVPSDDEYERNRKEQIKVINIQNDNKEIFVVNKEKDCKIF